MSGDLNKKTLEGFYRWMSRGDPDDIGTYVAEEFTDHDPFVNPQGNRDGLKQSVESLQSAFPDMNIRVEEFVAEGNVIAARFTASGTQQGQFINIPARGRTFQISGLDIVHFRDGLMVEHWGQIDQIGLLQQLGAMPDMEA